ncbi:MAG: hypothetical protein A2W25_14955 [candidate division Zixibacteria bacterium RBG_16_53_22]|nr:MAG: hypothetical protein A2W25_14955 [candidate division Zixibacteria bacterium RBG_16_53_22]
MRIVTTYFASILLILSCGQKNSQYPDEDEMRQEVLFHFSYLNNAWGYQNRGWFVDRQGLMKSYSINDPDQWNLAQESGPDSGYISQEALLANYDQADGQILEINYFELLEKYRLINPAAYGTYSELRSQGADRGAIQYFCYHWDYQRGRFKQVLLSLSGDFSRQNLAPEAGMIDLWLKELNEAYYDTLAST